MKTIGRVTIVFLAIFDFTGHVHVERCHGDLWSPIKPKEYRSSCGAFLFAVTPDPAIRKRPGHCTGELFFISDNRKTSVWSRPLINDIGPVKALVSTSGQYVVTMDEWANIGKLPIVVYGHDGRLICAHNLVSLGLKEQSSDGGWSDSALAFFGLNDRVLFIRLRSSKKLMIDLRFGDIMDEKWYARRKGWYITEEEWSSLRSFGDSESVKLAVGLLNSENANDRLTGVLVIDQAECRDAIPKLKELLNDEDYVTIKMGDAPTTKVFRVRKAAKEALEKMGVPIEDDIIVEEDER